MAYLSFTQLEHDCHKAPSVVEAITLNEAEALDCSAGQIRDRMRSMLRKMRSAIDYGLEKQSLSHTGLTGGDAAKLQKVVDDPDIPIVVDRLFSEALAGALATTEVNACMGRVVAAPTAGASGVLPGTLLAVAKAHSLSDEAIIDGLLVAGAIGEIFAASATLSGAAGGCQAEVGTASAMTAAAVCHVLGGSIEQIGHAAALALQGQLGLVCDPVGGLVEIPCVVRNATGSAVALAAAQMALAGVGFAIPLDEVILASVRIGRAIHPSLRETARAGLANTPTAHRLVADLQSATDSSERGSHTAHTAL